MSITASSSSAQRTSAERRAATIEKVKAFYRPQKPNAEVQTRKSRFETILAFAREYGGAWLTSVPGDREVRLDVLCGSGLPDELREAGYSISRDEPLDGERILPAAIIEVAQRAPDGTLVGVTEGSTLPVVEIKHSGVVRIERWKLNL